MSLSWSTIAAGLGRLRDRRIAGVGAAAVTVFAVGMWAGNEVPWGTKTPRTYVGKAFLQSTDSHLTDFMSDDGDLLIGFLATDVPWEAGGTTTSYGDPRVCLRHRQLVPVEISVVNFEPPGGGSYPAVVWARCR